jgi:hypothetical protein
MRFLVLIISLLCCASAFAQGGGTRPPAGAAGRAQRPARAMPPRAEAPRGTSIMRGQIVAAGNGAAIRRAQVRITSPESREGRVATTDQQGRFEFRELPAGRYTMTASKAGFVSLQYGQRRPSESGTPIELGDGQTMEKIAIVLPRGSVLSGRVTDEFGEPVANAYVRAFRFAYSGGIRRMTPGGQNAGDTTDDQGNYRLFGLPPGEYYVSAMLRGAGPEVTDPMGDLSGYASTYFPGTPNPAEATRITLGVAQENTSVSFGLIATRLVRVSGQVLMSDGGPAPAGVIMAIPSTASGRANIAIQQGAVTARIDTGAFRLTNVPPGRYQIQARAGGGREFELAKLELTVGNDDIDGLSLITAPGATITGSVASDTGEPLDFSANQLQINARPASPDIPGMVGGMGGVRVGDDWSFTLRNVSEAAIFRAAPPQGWALKAVYINGQDITDTPMEFPAGQTVGGMQIVLTKKITALTGQVTDASGNPVLDATVVAFPANEQLWTFQSRFIRAARPDQDGKYHLTGLPGAADYLVVALQGLEDGQAGDPEFLASIKELATEIELAEGESKALDVKLAAPR